MQIVLLFLTLWTASFSGRCSRVVRARGYTLTVRTLCDREVVSSIPTTAGLSRIHEG